MKPKWRYREKFSTKAYQIVATDIINSLVVRIVKYSMKKHVRFFVIYIDQLSKNLENNDNKAHEYIDLIKEGIMKSKNTEEIMKILKKFMSSAKMVYLGNFNQKQEELWKQAWLEAQTILNDASPKKIWIKK